MVKLLLKEILLLEMRFGYVMMLIVFQYLLFNIQVSERLNCVFFCSVRERLEFLPKSKKFFGRKRVETILSKTNFWIWV